MINDDDSFLTLLAVKKNGINSVTYKNTNINLTG